MGRNSFHVCTSQKPTMTALKLPDFDDLPARDGIPKGCSWGVFDRAGKKDRLGTLNILSPNVVREAARDISVGRVCL